MKRIENNTYELDVIDILALVLGTAMIIFGLISGSALFPIGIAFFSLIIWGRTSLKIISIIMGVIILFLYGFLLTFISATDFVLLGLGKDAIIVNYLALWPIIISSTISIFSIFYGWKNKQKYLDTAIICFIIFSALTALYNTLNYSGDNQLEALILYGILNFSLYMFSYIIAFTIYYIIFATLKFSVGKFNEFIINNYNSEVIEDNVSENIFNKLENKETDFNNYSKILARRIYINKRWYQQSSKLKGIISLVVGIIGTALSGMLLYFYIQFEHSNEYNFVVLNVYTTGVVISVILILIGTLLFKKENLNFSTIGVPMLIIGFIIGFLNGIYFYVYPILNFSSSSSDVLASFIIMVVIMIFLSVMSLCVYLYGILRKDKGPSVKCWDSFREVVAPLGLGVIMCTFALILYFVLTINVISEASTVIKILIIFIVIFFLLNTGITSLSSAMIKIFNKVSRPGDYLFSIKLSLDMLMLGLFLILMFESIVPENVLKIISVYSIIFVILGGIGYITTIISNIAKTKKRKSKKVMYSGFESILSNYIDSSSHSTQNHVIDDIKNLENKKNQIKIVENKEEYLF